MEHKEICLNESRIKELETKDIFLDKSIEQIRNSTYHMQKKIDKMNDNITELTSVLKVREDDFKKIDVLDTRLTNLESKQDSMRFIIPIACSVLSITITGIGIVIPYILHL